MVSILSLLALLLFAGIFWKHRQQAEWAKFLILKHCRNLQLQLLSVHYAGLDKQQLKQLRLVWCYEFEFTSVPDRQFSGTLWISQDGHEFQLSAYPEPELALQERPVTSSTKHHLDDY
ncbi:DUF3301 domain-containing protein [Celerinatantimonas sp. YJH-8]|uniref:DUF3301 domain-containing protein n=1 Tax=Celerinatantimonas sp. YJH-8 TaxID=3228714 RepID=UPI0038C51FAC